MKIIWKIEKREKRDVKNQKIAECMKNNCFDLRTQNFVYPPPGDSWIPSDVENRFEDTGIETISSKPTSAAIRNAVLMPKCHGTSKWIKLLYVSFKPLKILQFRTTWIDLFTQYEQTFIYKTHAFIEKTQLSLSPLSFLKSPFETILHWSILGKKRNIFDLTKVRGGIGNVRYLTLDNLYDEVNGRIWVRKNNEENFLKRRKHK